MTSNTSTNTKANKRLCLEISQKKKKKLQPTADDKNINL